MVSNLLLFEYKIFPSKIFLLLYDSIMVFFELNLALLPVIGSTTINVISFGTLNGLASDFFTVFLTNSSKIGSAALEPVSNFLLVVSFAISKSFDSLY